MATPIDLLTSQQPWFQDAMRAVFGAASGIPEAVGAITEPRNIPQPTVRRNRPMPVTRTIEQAPAVPIEQTPQMSTTPGPVAVDEMGRGIPVAPEGTVMSADLPVPPQAQSGEQSWWSRIPRGGGGMAVPFSWDVAPIPTTRRYDKPEFIYTNPASAQQAAANYAARLGAETQADASYRDYLARTSAERAAGQRAVQQTNFQRENLAAQTAEGAANRASAERIATLGETARQQRLADAAWQENEQAAEYGEQTAAMLNADPNAKVDRKWVFQDPSTGKWMPRFQRRPRPAAPTAPAVPAPVAPAPRVPAPVAPPLQWSPTNPAPAMPAVPVVPADQFLFTDFGPMAPRATRQPQLTTY